MAEAGPVSPDGCPVEVYRRLPPGREPELISRWMPLRGPILDLGAGVGRIADPLVDLGYEVLAVDNSPEMLSHVSRANTVLSSIEELRLSERFDAVLLASHLVNTADERRRSALLACSQRP